MHPRGLLIACGASALGAFATIAFLIPKGDTLSYDALYLAALLGASALAAFLYASASDVPEAQRGGARPAVDLYIIAKDNSVDETLASLPMLAYPRLCATAVYGAGAHVPPELLEGSAPLIAVVEGGYLPHPEFALRLAPYFADPSLSFVQAAERYDGPGRIADAYRSLAALGHAWERGRSALGAATLRGNGSLIARDALAEAYRPGMSWEELGVALQALGYTSRFESAPLVLAWAPLSLNEYRSRFIERAGLTWRVALAALFARRLPFEARLQYFAALAAYGAVACAALALALTPVALAVRGAGPLPFSPAALPGLILLLVCLATGWQAFRRLTGERPVYPAGLALSAAWAQSYYLARRALGSEPVRQFARAARQVIAREGGSAGTVPAGTPARS